MKSLLSMIFTAAIFLAVPIVIPVHASGDHDHCGHGSHRECPDPAPGSGSTGHKKDDKFTVKDFGVSVVIGCGFTSLYQGFANNRWRWPYEWCFDLFRSAPPVAAADGRLTPEPQAQPFGLNIEVKK